MLLHPGSLVFLCSLVCLFLGLVEEGLKLAVPTTHFLGSSYFHSAFVIPLLICHPFAPSIVLSSFPHSIRGTTGVWMLYRPHSRLDLRPIPTHPVEVSFPFSPFSSLILHFLGEG